MKQLLIIALIAQSLIFSQNILAQPQNNLEKERKETIQNLTNDRQKKANAGNTAGVQAADRAINAVRNATSIDMIHRTITDYNLGKYEGPQRNPSGARKVI